MNRDEIRRIRKSLGLTQHQFGQLLDVSRTTVMNWETGRTSPPELKQDIIRQLGRKADQRESGENDWARKLLALAAGGAFGMLLGKLFAPNDDKDS